ncbi:MAG: helix-turn-helix transcriptional regulator [Candidatus Nitrotoga sp.]
MTITAVKKTSPPKDWHRAKVISELHQVGITLAGLARAYGMTSSSSFSVALDRSYPLNEQRIADALGIHPKDIWPSRYNADGSPKLRGIRELQFNATALACNSKRAAADNRLKRSA